MSRTFLSPPAFPSNTRRTRSPRLSLFSDILPSLALLSSSTRPSQQYSVASVTRPFIVDMLLGSTVAPLPCAKFHASSLVLFFAADPTFSDWIRCDAGLIKALTTSATDDSAAETIRGKACGHFRSDLQAHANESAKGEKRNKKAFKAFSKMLGCESKRGGKDTATMDTATIASI